MPSPWSRDGAPLDADARTVLRLSALGLTTVEVAAQLGMTPKQVRRHVARAISILGARSKLEAVVIALRLRLIQLPTDNSGTVAARGK